MLTLQNISKSYDSLRAVDSVSLNVPRGQIVGLIGPNGSGKSTLLGVISGLLAADGGQMHFDGRDITSLSADQRFQAGLVRSYQDPSLFFRMSVLDNMLTPVKEQVGERPTHAPVHGRWIAQERTAAVHAGGLLARLKLRGHYAELAAELSGGQMKLLELGRSLMGEPKMLLLDEPTAGVAPNLAYTIFQQIDAMRRELGITFLIVEHRLEMLFDFVDSVSVMHMGQVIAQGAPDDVAQDAQVREVYFGE